MPGHWEVPQAGNRSADPAAKFVALPEPATEKAAYLGGAWLEDACEVGAWNFGGLGLWLRGFRV